MSLVISTPFGYSRGNAETDTERVSTAGGFPVYADPEQALEFESAYGRALDSAGLGHVSELAERVVARYVGPGELPGNPAEAGSLMAWFAVRAEIALRRGTPAHEVGLEIHQAAAMWRNGASVSGNHSTPGAVKGRIESRRKDGAARADAVKAAGPPESPGQDNADDGHWGGSQDGSSESESANHESGTGNGSGGRLFDHP